MEPKFQSSFIPKTAPVSGVAKPSYSGLSYSGARPIRRERDLFSLLTGAIFTLSLLLALGAFLYGFFLNYRIAQMGAELEEARATLAPETVQELVDLNSRIVSTDSLIRRHRILSPIFRFLEASTPKSVRYSDFSFDTTNKGLELTLHGAATSYAALASAAEVFNKNPSFREVSFSDLSLDDKGRVLFSMNGFVDPQILSYTRSVESLSSNSLQSASIQASFATSTASSTKSTR